MHGTRFLILFPGRTGSTWLVSALASHPQVRAEEEILVRRSAREQRAIIEERFGTPPHPGTSIGFKAKLKDVAELDRLADLIRTAPISIILMRRRDLLRLAISRVTARRLHERIGRWNLASGDAKAPAAPISPQELEEALLHCEATVQELDRFAGSLQVPLLETEYAELVSTPATSLDRVQRFLGVVPQTLSSGVRKNTHEDLRLAVPNFAELVAHFAGSRFAEAFRSSDPTRESAPPG